MNSEAAPDSGVQQATPEAPALTAALVNDVAHRTAIAVVLEAGVGERLCPPNARTEEDNVNANVLLGHAKHEDLSALRGEHFASPLHGALFELMRETLNLQSLAMMLRDRGFVGDIERTLDVLVWEVPALPLAHLKQHAARIVECWRRRQLLEAMRRAEALMCIDELTFDGAVVALRERILEVRG